MTAPASPLARTFSPPAAAKRYGVKPSTVIHWIRSGQLHAIDVSRQGSRRPRFRIDPTDLAIFEAARSATPARKPTRRWRKDPNVIQFF